VGHQQIHKYDKDTPSLHNIECEQKLHCVPDTTHFKTQKEKKEIPGTQFPEPHSFCRLLLE